VKWSPDSLTHDSLPYGKSPAEQANQEDLPRHASARWWELRKGIEKQSRPPIDLRAHRWQVRLRMTAGQPRRSATKPPLGKKPSTKVPKRPLAEKLVAGTLATIVWASDCQPNEERHVPLDRRVSSFFPDGGTCEPRGWNRPGLKCLSPVRTYTVARARNGLVSHDPTRQYEYAPAYSEGPVVPTDYRWPRGHALIRRLGGMQGRRTAFSGMAFLATRHIQRTASLSGNIESEH